MKSFILVFAVVALADELRPEVAETVRRFRADGVAVKVLSGDDPRTVAALAIQAGLDAGEPVPGAALDGLDDPALDALVARTTVFGRVAPEHKERIVASLRRQGRYVAMIGDGVNDARALKAAQVGVAMCSGSAVTRDVADIVLVDDSIVRGTTSVKLVQMMRDAGAREVHMRIASPPTKHSCFYGVDTPERAKLLAAQMSVEQMRDYINADSLAFISIEGLYRALGDERDTGQPQRCSWRATT